MSYLMRLELRKNRIRPFLYGGIIIGLCMLGFLYTFAMIAWVGGDSDAAEFSSCYNIFVLVNALQTTAYSIFTGVLFSVFLLKDYTGRYAVLVFSYPVERKKLLQSKILLVCSVTACFMLCGTGMMLALFLISEMLFPLVAEPLSLWLCVRIFADTALCLLLALFIGIIAVRIGFAKKSVQVTIVAAVVLGSATANVIATMSYSHIPFAVLFGVAFLLAIASYRGLKAEIERAEC